MRGGTSKAVFLRDADLPSHPEARLRTILSIFGSPDKRQIDGLGGADPLTSKVAIIGPPRTDLPQAANTHLTYTFGQVEIDHAAIDYLSLCGNISSAVGAFAVYEGLVTPTEPTTVVRVYNTNLERVLTIEVPVQGGRPLERGNYAVPGVPGTGAKILLDLAATAGAATGALLTTGNPVDVLDVPEVGTIRGDARGHRQMRTSSSALATWGSWGPRRRPRSTPMARCGSASSAFAARRRSRWA